MKSVLDIFRRPSMREEWERELDEARRGLNRALTGRDYADSMVAYEQRRISRLERCLKDQPSEQG